MAGDFPAFVSVTKTDLKPTENLEDVLPVNLKSGSQWLIMWDKVQAPEFTPHGNGLVFNISYFEGQLPQKEVTYNPGEEINGREPFTLKSKTWVQLVD